MATCSSWPPHCREGEGEKRWRQEGIGANLPVQRTAKLGLKGLVGWTGLTEADAREQREEAEGKRGEDVEAGSIMGSQCSNASQAEPSQSGPCHLDSWWRGHQGAQPLPGTRVHDRTWP